LRAFARLDPTLRHLPGILLDVYSPAHEYLIAIVEQLALEKLGKNEEAETCRRIEAALKLMRGAHES
jgi:hypothetical protein